MKQHLRWLLIGLLSLGLLLMANHSLAHENFPTINNSQLDSKVANLEISLRQLQLEVSQLRLQPQRERSPQSPQPLPLPNPNRTANNPATETQLKNLANLVIELKQDLNGLETRMTQLERQKP